jgi:DNA polymerase IV
MASRLRQAHLRARAVTLKLRSSDFRTHTRARGLPESSDVTEILWRAAAELFERSLSASMLPLRLLGVGAGRLTRDSVVQGDLFDHGVRDRHAALDRAVDAIRGQFGAGAIHRGNRLDSRDEE